MRLYCAYCIQHTWVCRLLSFPFSFVSTIFSIQKASRFLIREPVNRDFVSINKMYEWPVVLIFHSLLFCFYLRVRREFLDLHFCNPPKHPPSRKRDEHTWWQISAHSAVLLLLLLLLFRLLMSDAGRNFFSSPDIQIWAEGNQGLRKWRRRNEIYKIKILIYLSMYISMMIYGPIIWLAPIVDLSH
jgi:hypothetical protein